MNKCRLVTLYSGSDGNCTFVTSGETSILIDAGKSARTLCAKLAEIGSDIGKIDAIFITHEHCDHISALETLSKKYHIPIHMTEKSAKKLDRNPTAAVHSCLIRHDSTFCVEVGNMRVRAFPTPHDSLMSVCYRIELCTEEHKHTFGVATDIGFVSERIKEALMGCDAVVLESNHDEQMLMDGPYPYDLKLRIRSNKGHLSNCDCALLAAELAKEGTKGFILAHISRENNYPELAFDEVHGTISDDSVEICVASPDTPTELCCLGGGE
ncbi:MAG: MBL fold metallo-hydrolase [Ruminococcaceae bacterium]|nr:MBL fold metallo-hydrolase [Oscillospiraceae bacterium]